MLKMILRDMGVESDLALGGSQAIQMVRQRYMDVEPGLQLAPYRLIFMDYSMPVLDGIETTRLIRECVQEHGFDPDDLNQSPYICCLSAYHEQSYINQAYQVGMHNFMTKPAKFTDV